MTLLDLINANYATSREADEICVKLLRRLGQKVKYLPARLALARSLYLKSPPPMLSSDDVEGPVMRGLQLFGDEQDAAVWVSLIVQRSGEVVSTRKEFQSLVSAHWHRGATLLMEDWAESNDSLAEFVKRLAGYASLQGPGIGGVGTNVGTGSVGALLEGRIDVNVGEISVDVDTAEAVKFGVNAPGGSPHFAVMGGAGSGKTRTVVSILKEIRRYGAIPILAFDFKGDLTDSLGVAFSAGISSPPREAVPLDVLYCREKDDISLRETAMRIAESVARIKASRISGIQLSMLQESIFSVLMRTKKGSATLKDLAAELAKEYKKAGKKVDELVTTLDQISKFKVFEPQMSPSEFFSSSRVIRLPQDTPEETRKLVINMTLDSLDRWLNSLDDSPVRDGQRAVRHICLLDEAHVILKTKLPALSNLIRMSRSKGGVIVLASQSPDDFEAEGDDFLDNVGMTLAFNTQARAGATKRIFGNGASLTELAVGEALCRIRAEATTRRVKCWDKSTPPR